jgi:hypothetical protein
MPAMSVKTYAHRVRHGGLIVTSSREFDLDRERWQTYLSRSYVCVCGERLKDGDPVLLRSDSHIRPVHINCADLA